MSPFLFVSDLDNTLVGDDTAMAELNRRLAAHRQQLGTKIVYSTGRSLTSYRQLCSEKSLLTPDVLICAVGTEIYASLDGPPDPEWSAKLANNWQRDQVVSIGSHFADPMPQPNSEQRPFKVSYFLTPAAAPNLLPALQANLDQTGLATQLIYSGGKDLDILPQAANKGGALTFIRQRLGFAPDRTIACGDSGNDIALFADRAERGIIVGNALPELLDWHRAHPSPRRYLATAACAGGILEGLQHFGLL